MSLSPQRKSRWQANLKAAGLEVDEETLERVEPGIAERIEGLDQLLGRLDYHSKNPDYLRDTNEEETARGNA